jgi:hypothetical protein
VESSNHASESRVTPKQFLSKLAEQQKVPFQSVNTVANRIKWMLEHTMGAAGDFDRRKQELSLILKKNIKSMCSPFQYTCLSLDSEIKPRYYRRASC